MTIKTLKQLLYIVATFMLIAGLLVGCSDFLNNPEVQKDPNRAIDVHPDQLFNAIQISHFFMQEGALARTFSIWVQQMSGTDRQLLGYGRYEITEADHDGEFNDVYQGGGLIDIRNLIAKTSASNWVNYRGIAKVYEALVMGTAAAIWGNIPYSEAVNPDIPTPKLDRQADIYAALQSLLDDAIADLQSTTGGYLPPNDHVYGADLTKWVEFAHSLKARLYLHWGEAFEAGAELPSGYSNPYQQALAEAQQGISSLAGSFKSKHSEAEVESNTWYQFNRERDSYIRAGKFLVDLLKDRGDPRLPIYFAPDANGEFTGSDPNDGNVDASNLSAIYLAKDRSSDILTYEENLFIWAEAAFKTGDETTARDKLNEALAAIETKWNLAANSLPRYDTSVTGDALFEAIMMEKYIALFLNIEAYNDWKRTGYPKVIAFGATDFTQSPDIIPHRLPLSDDERQANPNVPDPTAQGAFPDPGPYGRNLNDPVKNPWL